MRIALTGYFGFWPNSWLDRDKRSSYVAMFTLYCCPKMKMWGMRVKYKNSCGSGGIRTHAPEETGALNQRLRPLGHATLLVHLQSQKRKHSSLFRFLLGDVLDEIVRNVIVKPLLLTHPKRSFKSEVLGFIRQSYRSSHGLLAIFKRCQ